MPTPRCLILGVNLITLNGQGYTTDVNNNWNGIGWTYFVPGAPCANIPSGIDIGVMFYVGGTSSAGNRFSIQITGNSSNGYFIRNMWDGAWGSWRQI